VRGGERLKAEKPGDYKSDRCCIEGLGIASDTLRNKERKEERDKKRKENEGSKLERND
jgi:hypothetical protein